MCPYCGGGGWVAACSFWNCNPWEECQQCGFKCSMVLVFYVVCYIEFFWIMFVVLLMFLLWSVGRKDRTGLDVEALKKLNKNKKLVKNLAKKYHASFASEAVIKQDSSPFGSWSQQSKHVLPLCFSGLGLWTFFLDKWCLGG